MHELNTEGWNEFPFEVNGVNYISKVAKNSPFMKQISKLPAGVFERMNEGAVRELVGVNLTKSQIIEKLATVNAGGSHAVIELA